MLPNQLRLGVEEKEKDPPSDAENAEELGDPDRATLRFFRNFDRSFEGGSRM